MRHRAICLLVLATVLLPAAAQAQVSVYSVLGIGFPSRPIGVRARALGGGFDVFDLTSPVNPATVAVSTRLTAAGTMLTSGRRYNAAGTEVGDLRDTRFPLATLSTRVGGTRITLAASYAPYADRTYRVTTADTVILRGSAVGIQNTLISDGALTDIRGALGLDLARRVQLGVAVHVISGSTRETITRIFSDSVYAPISQRGDAVYSALGFSVGIVAAPTRVLRVGAVVRRDGKLQVADALHPAGDVQLPLTVSGGVLFVPVPSLRWSFTAHWRSWSRADSALLSQTNDRAFDTWELGSGIELGGPDVGASRIPLRVGLRYAKLPFSPGVEQPREIDVAAGTGLELAGGRAILDFAIERAWRDGGGASERAWLVAVGLTLRP